MIIEIIVMYPIQHRKYRPGIDNLLVLLIGGIPIAMPTVLSVTMAIGSHRLSQQVGFFGNLMLILLVLAFLVCWFLCFCLYLIIAGSNYKKNDSHRGNGRHGRTLQ